MNRLGLFFIAPLVVALIAIPSAGQSTSYPEPELDKPMGDRDRSLSLDAYDNLGVPDFRRPWSPAAYVTALRIFATNAASTPGILPRKNSAKSGLLFSRLVADENFSDVANEALDPDKRGLMVIQFMKIIEDLALAYVGALRTDPSYGIELVEIYAFRMRFMIAANRWAESARRAPSADAGSEGRKIDPGAIVEKATLDAVMLAASLVADPTALQTSARTSLAGHLDANLPALLPSIAEPIQGRVTSYIAETGRREPNPRISGVLIGLARRLPQASPVSRANTESGASPERFSSRNPATSSRIPVTSSRIPVTNFDGPPDISRGMSRTSR